MTRGYFLVIGLVVLLAAVLLACTTPATSPTKAPPTVAPKPAPSATPVTTATTAPAATPIAWAQTVSELGKLPAHVTPAAIFTSMRAPDVKTQPIGAPVSLWGNVYDFTEQDGRSYLLLDTVPIVPGTTLRMMARSEPALVIGGALRGPIDRRQDIIVEGRFVGTLTAADKFGVATEMPVVLAQRIGQE